MAFLSPLAPLAASAIPTLLNRFFSGRDQKRARRKADRADAFANLQGSLNPQHQAARQGATAAPGIATGVTGDPLVQQQMRELMEKLMGVEGRPSDKDLSSLGGIDPKILEAAMALMQGGFRGAGGR